MISFERMRIALERKEPDRVPIITFTNIAHNNLSAGLTNFIRSNADAQYELYADEFSYLSFPGIGIELSISEIRNRNGWIERRYTHKDEKVFREVFSYGEKGLYRSYKEHIIGNIGDISSILVLPYTRPKNNPGFVEQIETFFQATCDHTHENEFCAFIINNPLSFICANTNPLNIAIWTITERDSLLEYLDEILNRTLEYLEYVLGKHEFPAIFIIGGAEFAIPPLMSPKDFDAFVYAYDKQIIELIHSNKKQVIVHCHGKINSFLPRFVDMGADGIHPLEPVGPTGDCDLTHIKEKYGGEICLVGNIQYEDFADSTPAEMENRVEALIDVAKEGGGFVLSPACPLFHSHMPEKIEDNIRAYIEAGLKFGKYT